MKQKIGVISLSSGLRNTRERESEKDDKEMAAMTAQIKTSFISCKQPACHSTLFVWGVGLDQGVE